MKKTGLCSSLNLSQYMLMYIVATLMQQNTLMNKAIFSLNYIFYNSSPQIHVPTNVNKNNKISHL